MEPLNLDDIQSITIMFIISFIVEYFKITYDLSIFNIFFFLNFIGIYYMLKKNKNINSYRL
jgi:hypothetical protein